jgi:chromosome segregation ATPase
MTTTVTLSTAEARQWLRLRQLRVQRARAALALALAAVEDAQRAIASRQALIDAGRARLDDLATTWSGAGCVDMPRWGEQLGAHRAALSERLERDEYALLEEQETLHQRQATVKQRRAELARAQAREDAVDATLHTQRLDCARTQEQHAELDAEEAWRAAH